MKRKKRQIDKKGFRIKKNLEKLFDNFTNSYNQTELIKTLFSILTCCSSKSKIQQEQAMHGTNIGSFDACAINYIREDMDIDQAAKNLVVLGSHLHSDNSNDDWFSLKSFHTK